MTKLCCLKQDNSQFLSVQALCKTGCKRTAPATVKLFRFGLAHLDYHVWDGMLEKYHRLRSASSPSLVVRPYAAVDVRRPSFPGCRFASLEQSATSRHVCTVTACFLQSSEDSSLKPQFSLTILLCLRSDTRHYGHFNRCSYLLTYLHKLQPKPKPTDELKSPC